MVIIIIDQEESANKEDFVIRRISPNVYHIEESKILLEIVDAAKILVAMPVIDSLGGDPPEAKMKTEEFIYCTESNVLLKFFVKKGQLVVEKAK